MQIYTIDELDDGSKNSVAKVSNMRINNVLIVCGNRSFTSTTRLTASQLTGVKFKETRDMEDYCKNLIGKKERYEATKDLLERSEILKLFPDYKTYAGVDESNFDKYRHDHTLNYNYADGDRNLSDLVEQAMNLERDIQVMVVAK